MTSSAPTVLVLDVFWRKMLPVLRSLGRAGMRVLVAERTPAAAGFFSRYVSRRFVIPSPARRPDAFREAVRRIVDTERVDVLFPGEEDTCLALLERSDAFPSPLRWPMGRLDAFQRLRDKASLPALAAEAGVELPPTWIPSSTEELMSLAEASAASTGSDRRFRIKPRLGAGGRGQRTGVRREELLELWAAVHARHPLPIVQEEVPSEGTMVGIGLLLDEDGRLRARCAHRRLRQYPLEGGSSTLRETLHAETLVDAAAAVCRAAGWAGLALVEFKQDPRNGRWYLIEVNPRPWGSLDCAVAAGVDFPRLAVGWALGEPPSPPPEYSGNVRTRWLLPGDLLHGAALLRNGRLPTALFRPSGAVSADELLDPADPGPLLGFPLMPFALWSVPEWRALAHD